jgi:hypothetical protein
MILPDLAPTPITVVPLFKSTIPQPDKIPETLMMPALATAAVKAEHEVTVVPLSLSPPMTQQRSLQVRQLEQHHKNFRQWWLA